MAKTVVGLMESQKEAQEVLQDLVNSGFKREAMSIMASNKEGQFKEGQQLGGERTEGAAKGAGAGAAVGGLAGLVFGLTAITIPGVGPIIAAGPIASLFAGAGVGAVAGGAIGAMTKMGVSEEDAHYYAEGVKRGGYLVTVACDDQDAEKAADIMRRHGAIDIDKRAESWRKEGWTRFDESAQPAEARAATARVEPPAAAARPQAGPSQAAAGQREGVIPVVEEEVQVGKRQVASGAVRVYSHIIQVPVEEEVRLREERAKVERRPVDRPATAAEGDAFRERTIEVQETREVPVVSKETRVKEEITVGKEAVERTEQVRESVRRTDVEVQQAGEQADVVSDAECQQHFSSTYGARERFELYRDAYHYAENISRDPQLRGKDEWQDAEELIHRRWESSHPGTWGKFREAIHYGWDKTHHHKH